MLVPHFIAAYAPRELRCPRCGNVVSDEEIDLMRKLDFGIQQQSRLP